MCRSAGASLRGAECEDGRERRPAPLSRAPIAPPEPKEPAPSRKRTKVPRIWPARALYAGIPRFGPEKAQALLAPTAESPIILPNLAGGSCGEETSPSICEGRPTNRVVHRDGPGTTHRGDIDEQGSYLFDAGARRRRFRSCWLQQLLLPEPLQRAEPVLQRAEPVLQRAEPLQHLRSLRARALRSLCCSGCEVVRLPA